MTTPTSVYSAMGTTLKFNSASVAHIQSIKGLELKGSTIDTTALDASGGYKTFVLGDKDAGSVSIQGFFNSADHTPLYNAFKGGTNDSYIIEFPDLVTPVTGHGSQWTFTGFVTDFKTDVKSGSAIMFDITIKVSGQPSFVQPA